MFATSYAAINLNKHYPLRIKDLGVISQELFSDDGLKLIKDC